MSKGGLIDPYVAIRPWPRLGLVPLGVYGTLVTPLGHKSGEWPIWVEYGVGQPPLRSAGHPLGWPTLILAARPLSWPPDLASFSVKLTMAITFASGLRIR